MTTTNQPTSNNNTNALYDKYSRYVAGGVTETQNGFIQWWEPFSFPRDISDQVYAVENKYAGSLSNISTVFYGEPRWWWFLAMYNNILDPFSEITPGRILLIPTIARLHLLIGTTQGGIPSTAQPVDTISPIIT